MSKLSFGKLGKGSYVYWTCLTSWHVWLLQRCCCNGRCVCIYSAAGSLSLEPSGENSEHWPGKTVSQLLEEASKSTLLSFRSDIWEAVPMQFGTAGFLNTVRWHYLCLCLRWSLSVTVTICFKASSVSVPGVTVAYCIDFCFHLWLRLLLCLRGFVIKSHLQTVWAF